VIGADVPVTEVAGADVASVHTSSLTGAAGTVPPSQAVNGMFRAP
jgi:hypothetical protein